MAGMYHLPDDIVLDIFARTPTNALLRFRCVSKHWNHMISDHITKSRLRRMILFPFKPLLAIDSNVTGDNGTIHSIFKLPSCLKNQESKHVRIAGIFNGIVLLVLKDMILYNPLTGAFKIVPKPPFKPSLESYGFGYGTTPDDLKIVRLTSSINKVYDDTIRCDVFSLKKGSWTTKSWRFSQECYIRQFAGTFLNGYLYWIGITKLRYFIVSLNVKEMVFLEIQLPFVDTLVSLGTSGGRLHACCVNPYKFELWVMDMTIPENPKLWSKVLTLNVPSDFNIPLSIIDEGKVVLLKPKNQKQAAIYDWLKVSYKVYEVNTHLRGLCSLQAMEYVESLISPSDLCSSKL